MRLPLGPVAAALRACAMPLLVGVACLTRDVPCCNRRDDPGHRAPMADRAPVVLDNQRVAVAAPAQLVRAGMACSDALRSVSGDVGILRRVAVRARVHLMIRHAPRRQIAGPPPPLLGIWPTRPVAARRRTDDVRMPCRAEPRALPVLNLDLGVATKALRHGKIGARRGNRDSREQHHETRNQYPESHPADGLHGLHAHHHTIMSAPGPWGRGSSPHRR